MSEERWTASRFIEVTRGGHRLDVTEDVVALDDEVRRLRALLKQAHDRDKCLPAEVENASHEPR